MLNDYVEMKKTLEELQTGLDEETAEKYAAQIDNLKQQVNGIKQNYDRLSYIMYLLDMPNKKSKVSKYERQEHKRLDKVPVEDREESIIEENKQALKSLKK